jgi:hypothetical protein
MKFYIHTETCMEVFIAGFKNHNSCVMDHMFVYPPQIHTLKP